MPSDAFSMNPSDSGLLGEPVVPPHVSGAPRMNDAGAERMPEPPPPTPVDHDDPEESLRNVPLPEGFMGRLRRFVDRL